MLRQLLVLSICCFLMFRGGLVKADEIVDSDVFMRELHEGVFRLKNVADELRCDVRILIKKSNPQIEMLQHIKSHTESTNDDVCDRIHGFFNSTYHNYNKFEISIILKLDEIQEKQSTRLNKIITTQEKNCQRSSALGVMSSALSEINEKIDKFDRQLKSFEFLEQKKKEQQDKLQARNDGLMKILKEINEKLTQNQLKFDNLEKQMPNLKEMTENLEQMSSQKKSCSQIDAILTLAQNQGKSPAV